MTALTAQSSVPDSMDGTIVEKICFIKGVNSSSAIAVYLRSGKMHIYQMIDFDPEDGEGVNTLTFTDSNGGEFALKLITDDDGEYMQLNSIKGESYPFNKNFMIFF